MWYRSHKWVMQPNTVYEIRREMRVRESRQTAIAINKKYQDIDTGKFDTDKLPTIYSQSLSDMIQDDYGESKYVRRFSLRHNVEEIKQEEYFPKFVPKFVPKDNNFDEECRQEEERKRAERKRDKLAKERKEEREREEERQREREKKREEEQSYQKQVKEAEIRAAAYFETQKRGNKNIVCNILPNKWVVKSLNNKRSNTT